MLEFNATILIAMISFVIFMALMNVVLYKPMLTIVQRRKALLQMNEEDMKENEKSTAELEQQRDAQIEEARANSRGIISSMTAEAKNQRAENLAKAAKDVNEYLDGKVGELNQDVVQAKHEIKSDVVGLAQEILGKISGEEFVLSGVSDEVYEKVINDES